MESVAQTAREWRGMRRKAVPNGELTIIPSLEDHEFFECADAFPFEPRRDDFSLANAWWAAEAAMLAYRDPDAVQEAVDEPGLMHSDEICAGGTHAYVLSSDDVVLVCFRGTQRASCDALEDAAQDMRFSLRPFFGSGRVHGTSLEAFHRIWDPLHDRLDALLRAKPSRPIWMTGHGLGGSLAALAAARFEAARGAFTFGCPRIGDSQFAATYPVPVFRFVHSNDYAAQLPPQLPSIVPRIGGCTHVGELRFIDRRGRVERSLGDRMDGALGRLVGNVRARIANLESCGWVMRGVGTQRKASIPEDAVRDHAPIYYAVHLWNALLERGGTSVRPD